MNCSFAEILFLYRAWVRTSEDKQENIALSTCLFGQTLRVDYLTNRVKKCISCMIPSPNCLVSLLHVLLCAVIDDEWDNSVNKEVGFFSS